MKHRLFAALLLLAVSGSGLVANAQDRVIRGAVTDEANDQPLAGVTVSVLGANHATQTDTQGNYRIEIPGSNQATLVFNYLGYRSEQRTVTGSQTLDVALAMDGQVLDEVVAIGYGTSRRKDLTGAISSIRSEEIVKVPVASAVEAIAGRLPGVQISATEGSPDAEMRIRVRGGGSITGDNTPLFIVDGFPVPTISDIAPADIESIDVLKDASSTAIYGSRGANGVIIVTTKSGTPGKFTVNYNGFGGPKRIANTLDVLDPLDYAYWQYERSLLDNTPETYTQFFGNFQDIDLYGEIKGNDWQEQTFGRIGHLFNHNLNINGGTEKTRYTLSYANINDKAIMQLSGYERNNLSLRLNNKPHERVTIDFSMRYSNTAIDGGGTNEQNEVSSADSRLKFSMLYPTIPVSGLAEETDTDQGFSLFSPLVALADNDRFRKRTNYTLNGSVGWEIIDGLRLKVEGGMDYHNNLDDRFYGNTTYYVRNVPADDNQDKPAIIFDKLYRRSYRSTNTLAYDLSKWLPDSQQLSVLAGQEYIVTQQETHTSVVHGFPRSFTFDDATKLSAQGSANAVENFLSPDDKLLSFFGRANYDIAGRYLFNATFRADGSSKFSEGNRWGYFPSFGAAWRLSDEAFMEGAAWLDDLKVRASYGTAGNNNIPPGQMTQTFDVRTTNWVSGFNSYWAASKTMANPDLKWETTVTRNIGLDFALLKSRLTGVLEIYQNNTKDLLIQFPTPGTGYDNQYRNMGETQNKGLEFSLNWIAVDRPDYGLSFGANIGFNRNKIISLGDMENFGHDSGWASTEVGVDYWVASGGQVGQMFGYRSDGRYEVADFEGFDEASGIWVLRDGVADASSIVGPLRPGSMKLADIVGDDGKVDISDRTVIGNANPMHTGGFNINAHAYGFDLSVLFNWSYGNDIYNANKIEYTSTSKYHSRNMISLMAEGNRWTNLLPDGTISNDPAQLEEMNRNTTLWSPYMSRFVFSDWAVEDGSFLRLNTLTLGYSLPSAWLDRVSLDRLRVYATGYNLYTWTNYTGFDPEVSTRRKTNLTPGVDYSAYPRSRMVVFGVNLSF